MLIKSKITGVCGKSSIRPALAGVLFGKNKIAATDSFKLVEIDVEGEVDALISAKYLKLGDDVIKNDKGQVLIMRKNGEVVLPASVPTEKADYPEYKIILDGAIKREGYEVYFNREFLVKLLEAMPEDKLTMRITNDASAAIYVYGEKCRGLLMPVKK